MLEQTDGVVPPLVLPQLLVLRLAKHGPVLLEVAEDREADRVPPVLPDPVHKPPVPAHPRTTRVGIVLTRATPQTGRQRAHQKMTSPWLPTCELTV